MIRLWQTDRNCCSLLPFLAAVSLLTATLVVAQTPTQLTTQNGTIAGTLRDTDGSPAAGVRVGAVVVPVNGETTREAALLSLTQTDNAGQYWLENVPPGRYLVMAGPLDSPAYFPGVAIRSAATVVTVAPQAEVTGIDFKMAIPPAFRFSGYVVREDMRASVPGGATGGNPAPQTTPAQFHLSNDVGFGSTALIADDGSFEFSAIRPGTYRVTITPGTPGVWSQSRTITMIDKDITDFRLVIPVQVLVAGTATVEGGGPQPRLELNLSTTTGPLTTTQTHGLGAGQANFTVGTAEYRVSVSDLPAGYVLKSMVSGNTDLAVAPLKVTEAGVPPVKVVLGVSSPPPWVHLSGRITGRAAPDMRLTLTSADNQVEPQTPLLYLDGSFEIPKVLPGTYLIADVARDTDTWVTVGNADLKDVVIGLLGTGDPLQKGATANGATSSVRVSGRISGRARTSSDASVRMTGTNLEEPLRASIFLDGSFEFLNVPAGTYSAEVHPPIAGAVAMNVTVGTADVKDLVLSVPDTKDLAGRVTIAGGGPMLRNLRISIGPRHTTSSALAPDGTFQMTASDRQMIRVDVDSLPPGYSVESMNYGNLDLRVNPIRFSATDTSDLHLHLRKTIPTVSVKGRVLDNSPKLSGSHIWLSHSSGAFHTLETSVAPDGAFSFANVVPGGYSVQLMAPGIRGTAVPVVVTETNLSEIQVTAPREVRGRVVAFGSRPIPRFSIPLIAGREETIVTVDPQTDGAFTVFLPAGEHRTGAPLGLPSGYALQSLSFGSVDLLREPLKVSSDNSSELLIRLKN